MLGDDPDKNLRMLHIILVSMSQTIKYINRGTIILFVLFKSTHVKWLPLCRYAFCGIIWSWSSASAKYVSIYVNLFNMLLKTSFSVGIRTPVLSTEIGQPELHQGLCYYLLSHFKSVHTNDLCLRSSKKSWYRIIKRSFWYAWRFVLKSYILF